MKTPKNSPFFGGTCALVIMASLVLGCRFLGSKDGVKGGDLSKIAENVPTFDPNAPLVSPGALAVRHLATLGPSLAAHAARVEAVERAAMNKGRDDLLKTIKNRGLTNETPGAPPPEKSVGFTERSTLEASPLSMLTFQYGPDSRSDDLQTAGLIASVVAGLKRHLMSDTKTGSVPNVEMSATETEGGATSTMTLGVGSGVDGSTSFTFGGETGSTINGVKVVTKFYGKIDGLECPNAEGQVPITVKLSLGAESGGTGYTQDLTAFVRAVVDDNAEIAETTIDVIQGTRQTRNGREVYVESGETVKVEGTHFDKATSSNLRLIQHTENATRSEVGELSAAGHTAALLAGRTALQIAESKWQNGGCVRIEAASPGNVETSSSTQIPVSVRHKYDGSQVTSKLDAVLKGEASVDPTSIAKTAGTLTYVAPAEKNKSATIGLTATSRRGRATLDLTASTGSNSYRVSGTSNKVSFTGEICGLDQPFVLDATFPGGSAKTSFTPSSATAGSTTVSGGGGGCTQSGGGNYTVTIKEDGSGTITWTTTDKLTCPGFGNSRTATFTLPLQPATDVTCP